MIELEITLGDILIRLFLGIIIGFCIGLTSIGGGVLVLPILTFLLKDPLVAVGTTTLYAFLTKIMATFQHLRLKTIAWKISILFLIGAIPGTILSAFWVSSKGNNEVFKSYLEQIIIAVIFLSVVVMIFNIIYEKKKIYSQNLPKNNPLLLCTLGLICGGLVGATSIGGGILVIPILIILFKLNTKKAVGTSILVAFIMTFITSIIYGSRGELDPITSVIMAIGSLYGVQLGSKLSVKLPDLKLKIIVLILIIIGALMMTFKNLN